MQPFEACITVKFPFAHILVGTIFAVWLLFRKNEREVLMRTCALLHNERHRAMITPISPLRTRLIAISPSYQTIPSDELYLKKYLIADGSSGSNGQTRILRERTYSRNAYYEWCFVIQVTCKMNGKYQTWNENIMNTDKAHWKEPDLTTLIR